MSKTTRSMSVADSKTVDLDEVKAAAISVLKLAKNLFKNNDHLCREISGLVSHVENYRGIVSNKAAGN